MKGENLGDLWKWMVPGILILVSVMLHAQESRIMIQVINGKNGTPVRDRHLLVFGGETPEDVRQHQNIFNLITDANGLASLAVPSTKIHWIQVSVDKLVLCQSGPNLNSFSVNEIMSAGLQTPNTCSSLTRKDVPGNFIVFSRSPTFFERMRW